MKSIYPTLRVTRVRRNRLVKGSKLQSQQLESLKSKLRRMRMLVSSPLKVRQEFLSKYNLHGHNTIHK